MFLLLGVRLLAATPVTALAFSPDGAKLLSGGHRQIDIRSVPAADIQWSVPCDLKKIQAITFGPKGHVFAVGGGDPGVSGEVRLITWTETQVTRTFGGATDLVTSVCFDGSGNRMAAASADHSVRIWRIDAPESPPLALAGHAGPVLAVAFSPGDKTVVTAGADRAIKVWDGMDGRLLCSFSQHTESIHALAFRPTARGPADAPVICATGGDDRTVRLWQPEIGRMMRIVRQHAGSVLALAWSADGRSLFTAGSEGVIRRFDGESDALEAQWRSHDDWIYALAVSPDGKSLASGDWSGQVLLRPIDGK